MMNEAGGFFSFLHLSASILKLFNYKVSHMKKILFLLLFAVTCCLLFTAPALAQTAWSDSGRTIHDDNDYEFLEYQGTIKKTDSLWTQPFTVFSKEPVIVLYKDITSTADSSKMIIERWENWTGTTWMKAKTLTPSPYDSVETPVKYIDTLYTGVAPDGVKYLFAGATGFGVTSDDTLRFYAKAKLKKRR
jgi:hypothetical protein